jgi:hypothetical protein
MPRKPLTIEIDPMGDLARALAHNREVVLESNGVRYTVKPEDIFANYDPQAVRQALQRSRGAFKGVDTKALLADLREQRGQDPPCCPD